jgi:hypothetical protein
MRHWYKRSIVIMGPTQQTPPHGRVTIDPWSGPPGPPVARLEGNSHPCSPDIGDMQASRAEAGSRGRQSALQMTYKTGERFSGQHQQEPAGW